MDFTFDIDKALDEFEKGEDSSVEIIGQENTGKDFADRCKSGHQESGELTNYRLENEVPKSQFHSEYQVWAEDSKCRRTEQFPKHDQSKTNCSFSSDAKNTFYHSQSTHPTYCDNEFSRISQKLKGGTSNESFPAIQASTLKDSLLQNSQSEDSSRTNSLSTSMIHSTDGYETNGYHISEEEEIISVSFDDTDPKDSEMNRHPEVNIQIKLLPSTSLAVKPENCNALVYESANLTSCGELKTEPILSDCFIRKPVLNTCSKNISDVHNENSPCETVPLDSNVIKHSECVEQERNDCIPLCQRISQDLDTLDFSRHSHSNQLPKDMPESEGNFRTTKSLNCESSAHILSDEKSNEDQGVSCSPGQCEVASFVSFTDVDPETNEVNLKEMEDYLSAVDMKDEIQDKDSGVSFQDGDLYLTGVTSFSGDVYDKKIKNKARTNDSTSKQGDLGDNSFELIYSKVLTSDEEKQISDCPSDFTSHQNTAENNIADERKIIKEDQGSLLIDNFFENVKEINRGARPKTNIGVNINTALGQDLYYQDQNGADVPRGQNSSHLLPVSKLSPEFTKATLQIEEEEQNGENLEYDNDIQSTGDAVDLLNSTNASQNKNIRVPRPTTLDLPARVTVKPKTSPTDLGIDDSSTPESEHHKDSGPDLEDGSIPSDTQLQAANTDNVLNETNHELGKKKPFWIPDADAPTCMHCSMKFTVIKRRHHCRACGKVLCSQCCSQKAKLAYLDNKEARVCQQCLVILSRVQDMEKLQSPGISNSSILSPDQGTTNSNVNNGTAPWRPNPNNPEDYVSTIPPLQQVQDNLNCPPPTVMVPGVLRKGDKPRGEPKTVIFADGIRPGGDLTDPEPSDLPSFLLKPMRGFRPKYSVGEHLSPGGTTYSIDNCKNKSSHPRHHQKRIVINDHEGPLHPILLPPDFDMEEKPNYEKLMNWLEDKQKRPVIFAVTKNLHILTKILKLDCCISRDCWCFTSRGLDTVGQDEVMVILQRLPDETFPRDVFHLFSTLYDNASKGSPVGELEHVLFPDGILGSREHSGFLFVRPTFQCLSKLTLPSPPYLVALLIQKWEVPWAKVFPLRLMLRLGAEFRYYPCPLISVRFRRPVFGEVGHTIVEILADFRNYQYTLQFIPGVVIHMEERKTCVNFPKNRYKKVMRILSNSNDNVLAFGSNFSTEADSHLVCMQNDNGDYQTQAINIQNTPRKVTGASFIAFGGALNTTEGLTAKSSIVEDGVLVQIPADVMVAMKNSLRKMKNFTIGCGRIGSPPEEEVMLLWTDDDKNFNIGVKSPIDNRALDGVQNARIFTGTDYAGEHYLIRWTEVFFIQKGDSGNGKCSEPADPTRLAESLAAACCNALTPYLEQLVEAEFTKIGLRATLGDMVGYEVGSQGDFLPGSYVEALDSALVPVISNASAFNQEGPLILELIFHIILK